MRGVGTVASLWCGLQGLVALIGVSVAGLSRLLRECVLFGAKLGRKIGRVTDTVLRHQLLLFRGTGLAGGKRLVQDRRCSGGNRSPFMELLPEEIGFVGQQDFGSLDLPEIKPLRGDLLGRHHDWVCVGAHEITEGLRRAHDLFERVFFFGLEGQGMDLGLPVLQVFQLRPSSVSRYFDTPVTDWASKSIVLLDLTARNLETTTVVPKGC